MNQPREAILTALLETLQADPQVFAMWLEGADAVGAVDAFSDLDVCCSVESGALQTVTERARQALARLGALDLVQATDPTPGQQHTVFHLQGTSEYLLIDFVAYTGCGSDFTLGDEIEKPLVLFDRAGVIRFHDPQEPQSAASRAERLQALRQTVAQSARIEKYIRRGNFLEAFGYYQRWLLTPLIEALRMKYTPLHPTYYIVHISRHLPSDVLLRLEDLFKIHSLAEIGAKTALALHFFEETVTELEDSSP